MRSWKNEYDSLSLHFQSFFNKFLFHANEIISFENSNLIRF